METCTLPSSSDPTESSFEGEREPQGAVICTGPDGVGDHRMTVEEQLHVGNTTVSPEATGDLRYIIRAPEVI